MNVLLIEDEELAAKRLTQLLQELLPDITVTGPLDSIEESVIHLQKHNSYDLIFLDIQLADGKSFSIFDRVKVDIPVIFTTAYDEYAMNAFEVNSIDYLLKPIHREKLANSLEKFNKIKSYFADESFHKISDFIKQANLSANKNYKTRFLVNGGNILLPINTSQIAYFYTEDKVVFLTTTANKKYIIPSTLDELEQTLDPKEFFRISRQFIVSIQAIHKIHNYFNYKLKVDLLPTAETEVIVSKSRVQSFRNWLNSD